MWQSLAFGPNYKAAYCLSVCPAGEDVIGPYLADRGGFLNEVVKPLQQNTEPVYVVPEVGRRGTCDAAVPAQAGAEVCGEACCPSTIAGFLSGIRHHLPARTNRPG